VSFDDKSLIERIRLGDEEAFAELVNRYKRKAFGIAYHFLNNAEDAKEISQEAFIKVYRSIHSFKGASSFFTWFYRILTNLCIDFSRSRKIVMSIPFSQLKSSDDDLPSVEERIQDAKQENPLKALAAEELKKKIAHAIQSLPDRQRMVFVLRHYDQLQLSDIARVLNCAEGTVKSHLYRAVATLQDKLEDSLKESDGRGGRA